MLFSIQVNFSAVPAKCYFFFSVESCLRYESIAVHKHVLFFNHHWSLNYYIRCFTLLILKSLNIVNFSRRDISYVRTRALSQRSSFFFYAVHLHFGGADFSFTSVCLHWFYWDHSFFYRESIKRFKYGK